MALWLLGYPEAALADADHAIKDAREIGQAATSDVCAGLTQASLHPLRELCDSKRALLMNLSLWRTKKAPCFGRRYGMLCARLRFCHERQTSDAVQMITSGIAA